MPKANAFLSPSSAEAENLGTCFNFCKIALRKRDSARSQGFEQLANIWTGLRGGSSDHNDRRRFNLGIYVHFAVDRPTNLKALLTNHDGARKFLEAVDVTIAYHLNALVSHRSPSKCRSECFNSIFNGECVVDIRRIRLNNEGHLLAPHHHDLR